MGPASAAAGRGASPRWDDVGANWCAGLDEGQFDATDMIGRRIRDAFAEALAPSQLPSRRRDTAPATPAIIDRA
jgi:hypothetical protein